MTHDDAQRALHELGLAQVFVPQTQPDARAQVVASRHEPLCLTPVHEFPRAQATDAEAAFIDNVGDGAASFYGGCIKGVAISGNHQLYYHAGRESLTDFARAYQEWHTDNGVPNGIEFPGTPRRHESILHAIAAAFANRGVSASRVRLFCYGCIPPTKFIHSPDSDVHGAKNRILLSYLEHRNWSGAVSSDYALDLGTLIKIQAAELHMCVEELRYLPSDDSFPTTGHPDPKIRTLRSLGVFIRES